VSELIVIGDDDQAAATRASETIVRLQDADVVVGLHGLAVVSVDEEGKTHVVTPQKIVSSSAAGGALFGAVVGLLFLMPVFGVAIGGAIGAFMGKVTKSGVDDQFRAEVRDLLQPGTAALVVMASKIVEDDFAVALRPLHGHLLKTSLSADEEADLAHDLSGQ